MTCEVLTVARAALGGDVDLGPPGQVCPGQRCGVVQDVLDGTFSNHLAAVFTRARSQVQDPVGGADGFVVMFDHQHGIAQVAQALERAQQAVVVAWVQPDRRLIQHVQHAHQARADLGCQADALRFAAGKRACGALQGQVIQPDIDQEAQPFTDLLQDAFSDGLLAWVERCIRSIDALHPFQGVQDRPFGDLHDVCVIDW